MAVVVLPELKPGLYAGRGVVYEQNSIDVAKNQYEQLQSHQPMKRQGL